MRDILDSPLVAFINPLYDDVIEFSFPIMVHPPALTVNDCIGNNMFSAVDDMNIPLLRAVHTPGWLRQKVALVFQKVLDASLPFVEGFSLQNLLDDTGCLCLMIHAPIPLVNFRQ